MTNEARADLPTKYGMFQIAVYSAEKQEHVALTIGDITKQPTLTRVHSQCFTGDTLGSKRCDCREQLEKSMELIGKKGSGVVVYLNQEGRGIGLANKIKAYNLQDQGYDTVEANQMLGLPIDARDYTAAAEILGDLGVKNIDLLTNNPDKETQLRALGVSIHEIIPLEMRPNGINTEYLTTKKRKLGHRLTEV